MRLLEAEGVAFEVRTYDPEGDRGDPEGIFKTLVATGGGNLTAVFCIPLVLELNLRKAAAAAGFKKVDLVSLEDLHPLTGYHRGGCSPLAMKRLYPTFLDETAQLYPRIRISAGQVGLQVELAPQDLVRLGSKLLPRMEWADLA